MLRPHGRLDRKALNSKRRGIAVQEAFSAHATGATSDEPAGDRPARRRGRLSTVYDEDRQVIGAFIEDFARELGDQAPRKSSTTRAYILYRIVGASREAFISRLYEARSITRKQSAGIRMKAGDTTRLLSPS